MSETDFFLIIDGSSLLTTQFFGNLPKEVLFAKTQEEKEKFYHKIMRNSKGEYTNGIYGFFRTLFRILNEQKPTYLAVTWDISRNTFRRQLYQEYKAQRSAIIPPLREQFISCQGALRDIGICQLMDENYEADDFSGTLAARFEKEVPVRIITKDNDYLQLVSDNTRLWLIHGSAKKTEELFKKYKINPSELRIPDRCFEFTPELVKEEFGIEPASVPDLKGLQGDSSDNIKGVPGVGEKAASALIGYYGTIENLYHEIRNANEESIRETNRKWKEELKLSRSPIPYLLKTGEELVGEKAAVLSKQLATIKRDVPLTSESLSDYRVKVDIKAAKKVLNQLEFTSLLAELPDKEEKKERVVNYRWIDDLSEAEAFFRSVQGTLAISRIKDGIDIYGYAFCIMEEQVVFLRLSGFITEELIVERVTDIICKNCSLLAFGIKEIPILARSAKPEQCFDCKLAAYLLNPLKSDYNYASVSLDYLGKAVNNKDDLPKGVSYGEAESLCPEILLSVCCAEALTAFQAYPVLKRELQRMQMETVFYSIEMPLLFVLYQMEQRGICADRKELINFGDRLSQEIKQLERVIYQEAGEKFNINSPKQLGVILFEKLKLPHGKKTKNGYSTSVDILEKLKEDSVLVDRVLEYRQLTKLKSTYADGLADAIGTDGRIHCCFHQTVTATGRLSCTEPNLQNIPIRVELGRSIRKVFVPNPGYVFIDADYSQIELRILASLSKDQNLIDAYKNSMDIHRLTASQVFHVPFEEVNSTQRSNAKAVNFGIIYGISSFGLGQGLNISRKEAELYIKKYFEAYPVIKGFLDGLVEIGRRDGFIRTEYGRVRPIPELSSDNFMQRSFGERIAMNSPIQGTAADIIKLAMIRVEHRLQNETKHSCLILQIHDELLVEALEEEKELVKKILQEEMQAASNLSVPLEVEVKEGGNWYEAK